MLIRIALIGSEKMVNKVLSLSLKENVHIHPFVYEKPEESANLVKQASNYDVLFFTGPVPYFLARKEIEKLDLPAVFIPLDELGFTLSLFHIKNALFVHPDRLSIDIPRKEVVYHVLDELDLDRSHIYIKEFEKGIKHDLYTDEILQFHREQWQAQKVDFVLTSVQSVHKELQKLGIPSFRIIIPQKNVLDTLDSAIQAAELMISKASQIAVCIVRLSSAQEKQPSLSPHLLSDIRPILLDFAKKIDASLKEADEQTCYIYGTRRGIQHFTNHYRELPVLEQFKGLRDVKASFGFGFGRTVTEAEEHAQIGLFHAEKGRGDEAYIVTEDKKVIGPLNEKVTKSFQLLSLDEKLLAVIKQSGISVATMTKIIDFLRLRHNPIFSASDLADYLQVSKRTAERIMKKLVDNRYAEITGEEQPYQKGRPRALYRILL
ncbi:HTH domain-containing protein [Brevibacillus ruminantium]|uniref:HTH domain-containing protein n=1 Tax=Brevibacillus ruminantium TaxID=2950604 RepID=A0ABY4WJD8_9BACL|nr:HTH domain-containing protein [Brevibacillus ruminantium]USG65479.1 HTH domain-containing protein [Brevibacillus ruminantium]